MAVRNRQDFDMFVDDQYNGRVSAFSKKQAVAWFSKSHGYENFSAIKDRIEAKLARPVEIAKGCPECGYISSNEASHCPNCDAVFENHRPLTT